MNPRQRKCLKAWAPVVLVWSCIALLPFGRLVEAPVLIMAAIGLYLLVRRGRELSESRAFRLFTTVFLLAWVPIAISYLDAVNPSRTLVVVVNHLRFYFAGVFMLHALASGVAQRRFLMLAAWMLAFWVLDALVQSIFGADLFGRRAPWMALSGIFGLDDRHFAVFMAIFSPLLWEQARRRWSAWIQVLVFITTIFVIISGGARAAWITIICVIAAYAILFWVRRRTFPWKPVLLSLVLGIAIGVVGYGVSEPFQHRVNQSLLEAEKPFQSGNLGHRAWIWRGSWNMFLANPVNGVGARGFRYAFAAHADPNDPFMALDPPVEPAHSHQMIMEVATETGFIGVAGFFAMIVLLARFGWRATAGAQRYMLPYALALAAAYFPLNTHWAIYGSYLSQVLWYLIALYLAAFAAGTTENAAAARET